MSVGTQIDGLGHAVVEGRSYNNVSLSENLGLNGLNRLGIETIPPIATRGILLNIAAVRDVDSLQLGEAITVADIEAALEQQNIQIGTGDVVLLHTGWMDAMLRADPLRYVNSEPGLGVEAAQFLAGQNVVAVGLDVAQIDPIGETDDYSRPAHKVLLIDNGVFTLENINTSELARDKVYEFMLVFGRFVMAALLKLQLIPLPFAKVSIIMKSKSFIILLAAIALIVCFPINAQSNRPAYATGNELQEIISFPHRPTGIDVAQDGRIFVSLPFSNYSDPETFTGSVMVIENGVASPYPNVEWNRTPTQAQNAAPDTIFYNVQSLTLATDGTLWILDRGRPLNKSVVEAGAKLVGIDTSTNEISQIFTFESIIAENNFLNDVRVGPNRCTAYITDTGNGGIVVVDLNTGTQRRALHAEDGFVTFEPETPIAQGVVIDAERRRSAPITADGIALSKRVKHFFFKPILG